MANDFLGQILGSVLGDGRPRHGPLGGSSGLGDLLGGMMGRGAGTDGRLGGLGGLSGPGGLRMGRGRGGDLTALLLPLAMQWVQRNGGLGGVLQRFQQNGYGQQAASWVSTADNDPIPAQAINDVVGMDELSRLSQQLGGADQGDVADGMAQILPEVVNQLTPDGRMRDDADDMLGRGISTLESYFQPDEGREG